MVNQLDGRRLLVEAVFLCLLVLLLVRGQQLLLVGLLYWIRLDDLNLRSTTVRHGIGTGVGNDLDAQILLVDLVQGVIEVVVVVIAIHLPYQIAKKSLVFLKVVVFFLLDDFFLFDDFLQWLDLGQIHVGEP